MHVTCITNPDVSLTFGKSRLLHHCIKLRPFPNTPITPGIIGSGTKLSLLTETLTGTFVELRRLSTQDFTLTINRESGIKIPEAWMPTIRQHDNRLLPQRTVEGSVSSSHNANNALDRNALLDHERGLRYTNH